MLLVHRPRYEDWSWPKGKAKLNEPLMLAATREVEEETGQVVALGAPLTVQRYRLGSGQTKEVTYWTGTVLPDGPALRTRRPVERAEPREIDDVRWVRPEQARTMLTRRGDKRMLSEILARAADGTLVTSTLILLRHAQAVARTEWQGGEATRPLTRLGVQQAIDIVGMLSAFGVRTVITSPWERCATTVAPYVTLGGASTWTRPILTERAMAEEPAQGTALVEELVRASFQPTVLSVHRPTVPALMEPLVRASSTRIQSAFPAESPWLGTAEMLVVHLSHASAPLVQAIERHTAYTRLTVVA